MSTRGVRPMTATPLPVVSGGPAFMLCTTSTGVSVGYRMRRYRGTFGRWVGESTTHVDSTATTDARAL